MSAPKFNFIPERQIGKEVCSSYRVSIAKKGLLRFPKEVIHVYELEGKFIRLFADVEKKVIGWSILEGKTELDVLADARKLSINGKTGQGTLGITKLLNALEMDITRSYLGLEVKEYKSVLQNGSIWYVQLTKEIK